MGRNMTYRVVVWGTGNTGRLALRGVINHPELELVGLLVHNSDKAGHDAATLCGAEEMSPTGITATADFDELLGIEADCLVYMGDGVIDPVTSVKNIVPFLE